jgi:hypothetical protein
VGFIQENTVAVVYIHVVSILYQPLPNRTTLQREQWAPESGDS